MGKYSVSALASVALETVELTADTEEEAEEKFVALFEAVGVKELDWEWEHFTVEKVVEEES